MPKHFLHCRALQKCEWLLSRWMMGMKLLQINKQRAERRSWGAFALSVISCRGKKIYTLIINLLWPHLSSGLPQHSARVDQPDPRAYKPRLFAVMNGQWAIDGGGSKWRAPSWVGCCSAVRTQTERASCFSQDWSWPFFRSVWIICLTSWESSTEWLFTCREAFDWHACRPLRRQRSCPLYFFAGDAQQHAVLFTAEY